MSQAYNPSQTQTAGEPTASTVDANARTVHYKCGDCDMDVPLKRGEPIRCRNCGHRVLYKQRTNRSRHDEPLPPSISCSPSAQLSYLPTHGNPALRLF
ncbi:metallothionein-i transcription activator [Stemphylium lycopersici]|uniref:Metallothionein-i transcription activator n=1 Tax=Stemphylium lycopersici TaxID=183478 RepID=A0A364MWQ2_STELY|nr:metallothionein-i transcription activator [Stemphylium lycopersici]RAR00278.1 metallothionein-i transcription activator [Stemphylium lycopersici]RAR05169.1 metallothionein-i transcription activator [Stemphylium lycopersici]